MGEGAEGMAPKPFSQSPPDDDFIPDPSVGSVTFDQHMDVRHKLQVSEQHRRDLELEIAKLQRQIEDGFQAKNKIDIVRIRLEEEKSDLRQRQDRLEQELSRQSEESGQQRMELARMRRQADAAVQHQDLDNSNHELAVKYS